jgi:hypothetical protein
MARSLFMSIRERYIGEILMGLPSEDQPLLPLHTGSDPFPHFDEKPLTPFDDPDDVEIEEGDEDEDDGDD